MTVREYAKRCGFEVFGKLTRHPELEYTHDGFDWSQKHDRCKHYLDEGGNEYIIGKNGVCIVTAEGDVI